MSVSSVSFNEDVLLVTIDSTAPPEVVITPSVAVVEIAAVGLQGGVGPAGADGATGPQGPPGASGNAAVFYHHDQMVASDLWTVTHNLGYNPNVSVTDSAGTNYEGLVTYVDNTSLTLTFSAAFAGTADCS
jgi:hypothetical protein